MPNKEKYMIINRINDIKNKIFFVQGSLYEFDVDDIYDLLDAVFNSCVDLQDFILKLESDL